MTYDLLFPICAVVYTLGVLACGIVIGATFVSDWLHRRETRPAKPVTKRPETAPTMPRAWAEHWARLNTPTVTRRRGEN